MEFLPQKITIMEIRNPKSEIRNRLKSFRNSIIGYLVCGFWFFAVTLGCVTLPKKGSDDEMPHGAVCQAVATWNHEVVFAPDPTHGGAEGPGLVGRLYLFGPEISYPLIDDGSVVVDLFDDTSLSPGGRGVGGEGAAAQPIPIEEWRIDSATLNRLAKRDMIGWGYTLFLPWGTYKPEINQVHLKLRYVNSKGNSFFAESGPLTLNSTKTTISHRTVPAANKSDLQLTSGTATK